MKRWGAALACGLILASGLTSTAYAAEPAAPAAASPSSSSDATCSPLVEGQFGRLSADQIGSGTIARGETRCHDVRLSAGRHFIQFTGFTALRSATLQDAQGAAVCTAPPGYQWECDVPVAGDYTVVVQNLRGPTPVDYKIAVTSENPARCTTRVGTAWNAARVRFPAVGVEVQCVRFTGSAGERILAYSSSGRIAVRDAADKLVCTVPTERYGPCELTADGLYRAISVAEPSRTTSEIQVRSLSPVKGCPTVRPGKFGATPGDRNVVRCRTLKVTEPGTYFVGTVDADGTAPNFVIMAADGSLPCSTSGYPYVDGDTCTFTAAGTYTLIIGSMSSQVRDESFTTTFVPSTAPGCTTISAYGLDEPGKRGRFRAAGQVDCYQFELPDGLETHLVYPAGATGAASPLPRVYGDDGTLLCTSSDCTLSGSRTYRLLLTAPGGATGDYVFALRRNAISESCRPWTPDVVAQFGRDRFTNCFTFVADKTGEMDIAVERLSGSNSVDAEVVYNAGPPCDPGDATTFTCSLETSLTTTLVLTGQPTAARYRITKIERGETPPPPTDPPPPATCGPVAPLTESRYGPLAADQIATVTVPPGKLGCHPIHLSAGWHTIRIDGPPLPGSGWVHAADDSRVCLLLRGRIFSCRISEAGDYTIKLGNESGATDFGYRLVATLRDAADCTADISTAWNAPSVRVPHSDPLESHCVRFTASAGEKVIGFAEGGSIDVDKADGTPVCAFPWRSTNPPCELTAGGTYVASSRAGADRDFDEIQIRSVTAPVGCPVVEPGKPSTDPFSDVRCRRVTIPAAGTYDVSAVSESGEQRSIVVLTDQGTPACGSGAPITNGQCAFPAAGTYTLVIDGQTAALKAGAFSATVTAAE
ncbi:hypothetical protein OWR29_36645 [Actinoplanes sp. Pm04-4]|uniref:Uncharacterized protein n=1 Tax=Paractinoplanes pyxinae TaxID=2997416 RepID=A0ABT4BAP4_9ACTN|nr:hypothetical protein [Actinoplanes pyxinae]MCY1143561.1 hypothetical protein [Actinoplanes pyxinae]